MCFYSWISWALHRTPSENLLYSPSSFLIYVLRASYPGLSRIPTTLCPEKDVVSQPWPGMEAVFPTLAQRAVCTWVSVVGGEAGREVCGSVRATRRDSACV